ncbi:MAG: hypothetical protein MUO36_01260, partial [Candidatus Hadarchaeum sp.]|nr:hypothetical protein [Candidatus Hadarchaeum sp.]
IDRSYKAGGEIEEQVSHISNKSTKKKTTKELLASDLTAETPLARAVDRTQIGGAGNQRPEQDRLGEEQIG